MRLQLVPKSLRYLEAVAKHGSIQAAARALRISASAIDRQILILEDSVGLRLFERHASGMTPTKAGEMLFVLARRWHNDGSDVWSELQQLQGVHLGLVRVAMMDSQVNGLVPEFVEAVASRFPLVQLEIDVMTPADSVLAVDQGTADLALAFNVRPHRSIDVLWSRSLPLGCVAAPPHPLAAEPALALRQVVAQPLVLQSHALSIRQVIDLDHDHLLHEGRQPVTTNSLQLLKRLTASGRYVALTSELDAAAEILDGSLVFVPVTDAAPQSVSVIASNVRGLSTISRSVGEILAACAETLLARLSNGEGSARQV